ncbi:hypothetical protein [Nocardia sp. NPDC051750]|uniref:hypothetical protein n=1 Tax=Nocardia sp. NPDC051750 TaxID=3364325 RepID=UPI0037A2A2F7
MNSVMAAELLLFHSGTHPDIDDPRWEQGFLGMLRPYKGLREENFHSVMSCLRVLAPTLQHDSLDRSAVSSLWGICHLGRTWGVCPDGMLRRNDLISAADVQRLENWIDCISYAVLCLFEGATEEAFAEYDMHWTEH